MPHHQPAFKLTVDGKDITGTVKPRLESLSLTDNRGFEADTLDICLADHDGLLALPRRGATVELALGWDGAELEDKGSYKVDEVEHAGAPDKITLRARSADLRAGLTTKREKSWHGVTIGDLVKSIAAANDLTPVVGEKFANLPIEHIDQTAESDANLLTRLAQDFDAITTVKAGRLLFIAAGQATSASGKPLPEVTLTRQSGDQHRFAVADRAGYTAVRANYNDPKLGRRAYVEVGEETISGEEAADPTGPSTANTKTLRHTYANKTNATRAAEAEWQRIQRGMAQFTLTLARGRADLFPEIPIAVAGFKEEIDSTKWICVRVRHDLSTNGFTTSLDLEVKPEELGE